MMDQRRAMWVDAKDPRRRQEPWLVFDRRDALEAKNEPGMHVFIAGVSDYQNLPREGEPDTDDNYELHRLSSATLTAHLILDWLLTADESGRLALPLATCRILLSPTPEEIDISRKNSQEGAITPSLGDIATPRCTRSRFTSAATSWRRDAKRSKESATFFYFVGHGFRGAGREQLLLMDEFGEPGPVAPNVIDMSSLLNGMAPHNPDDPTSVLPDFVRPEIARTQSYFVDACAAYPPRLKPLATLRTTPAFEIDEPNMLDDRKMALLYASLPGGETHALPSTSTLFSMALLRCLQGEAARPPKHESTGRARTHWTVSSASIAEGLPTVLDDLNYQLGANEREPPSQGSDVQLCFYETAPNVPFRFVVEPAHAIEAALLEVRRLNPMTVCCSLRQPPDEHPFRRDLSAGNYQVVTSISKPELGFQAPAEDGYFNVEPLRSRLWRITMREGAGGTS
jgi:hypothetical protein